LQEFVWRWISETDSRIVGWVENAVKQDSFIPQLMGGNSHSEELRHSVSIIDVFRSFNQSIEEIVGLNWDDDLQYAKFMTTMSKAIGAGVARYCELVEQKFSKEMEFLTPEQEANAALTRQDRWMQYAKDAWANKEKIEPFQFQPEVVVQPNSV
jgi:hypothetical protein